MCPLLTAQSMRLRPPGKMTEAGKEVSLPPCGLKIKRLILKRAKSPNFLAGLALLFSILLFFSDLFTDRYIFTERDLAPYFIPPRFFATESIRNGDFPLWNPYQFTGHPFFANPQHALLYPLNLLFFVLPFDLAFNSIIILHFFLGGFFLYFLLRELGARLGSALAGGLIFMLSGYLLSIHSLLNSLLSVVWTPLVLIFFRRAIANPGLHNEMLAALFMAISFFGGGVEIVYGNFFILLLLLIFPPALRLPAESFKKKLWKRSKIFITTSLAFILLSAVQLLPFLELYTHSIRGQGISLAEATIWSFAPRDFLLFFLPDAYGYFLDTQNYWTSQCWLKTLYVGGLPFLLALFFILLSRERRFYLCLIFISFFLALGISNPLYPLVFKYLPFFSGVRYPVKFLYIFFLTLAITAGLGLEKLQTYSPPHHNKKIKYFLTAAALICGFLLLLAVGGEKEMAEFFKRLGLTSSNSTLLLANIKNTQRLLFYLTIFLLLLRLSQEWSWPKWTSGLLVLFLIFDLFGNMGFFGKEKTKEFFQKTRIMEIIFADNGFYRSFTTPRTASLDSPLLIPNPTPLKYLQEKHLSSMFLIHKIPHIWGIEVLPIKRADDLYKAFTISPSLLATNLLYLYGVKYVISTQFLVDKNFELVYAGVQDLPGKEEELLKKDTIKLYRLRHYLPRAWLVEKYKTLPAQDIIPALQQTDFHPGQVAILEEEPQWAGDIARSKLFLHLPKNKVVFMEEKNNRLILRVSCPQDSLLVLSDTYYPGWHASLRSLMTEADSVPQNFAAKILRANYNFRALALRAGEYEIVFSYEPFSFKVGLFISLSFGLSTLIYFFFKPAGAGRPPDSLLLR